MEQRKKYILPVTAHPCRILLLADGALVERARRSRRADRDAPNESSVAQMRAELWPETRFCPFGALVERAGRSRRADRDAPNESSVAQLGAELWPETCFGCHPKRRGRIHVVFGALDDHPCMHYRPSNTFTNQEYLYLLLRVNSDDGSMVG